MQGCDQLGRMVAGRTALHLYAVHLAPYDFPHDHGITGHLVLDMLHKYPPLYPPQLMDMHICSKTYRQQS